MGTWCFHCWGPGSIPGRGAKTLQATGCVPHLKKGNYLRVKLRVFWGRRNLSKVTKRQAGPQRSAKETWSLQAQSHEEKTRCQLRRGKRKTLHHTVKALKCGKRASLCEQRRTLRLERDDSAEMFAQPSVFIKGSGTGRGKGASCFHFFEYLNRHKSTGMGRQADLRAETMNRPGGRYSGPSASMRSTSMRSASSHSTNCRSKMFGEKNSRTFQESKI